jgi:Ca2+-binding EF-hand superfamily protein
MSTPGTGQADGIGDGFGLSDLDIDGTFEELFDRDGDGLVGAADLISGASELGLVIAAQDAAALIAQVDADADGMICKAEFIAALSTMNFSDSFKGAFALADQDGDGYISRAELEGLARSIGAPTDLVVTLMERFDHDGDSKLSLAEFIALLTGR